MEDWIDVFYLGSDIILRMSLLKSQLPLFKFLAICSYIAFKYDKKKFKTSKPFTTYCISIAIIIQVFFWHISTLPYISMASKFQESEIIGLVHLLESFSLEFGLLPILVNAFINQNNQVKLMHKIMKIENKIYLLGYRINQKQRYRKFKVAAIVSIISTFLFYTSLLILIEMFIYPEKDHVFVSLQVFILLTHVVLTIFFNTMTIFMILLVKIIRIMFQTINLSLQQELAKRTPNFRRFVRILELQRKQRKIITLFGKSFGIAILAGFLEHVGILTCELFIDYLSLIHFEKFTLWKLIIYNSVNLIWCVPLVVSFGVLGFECEKVVNEIDRKVFLLEQLKVEGSDKNKYEAMVKPRRIHFQEIFNIFNKYFRYIKNFYKE